MYCCQRSNQKHNIVQDWLDRHQSVSGLLGVVGMPHMSRATPQNIKDLQKLMDKLIADARRATVEDRSPLGIFQASLSASSLLSNPSLESISAAFPMSMLRQSQVALLREERAALEGKVSCCIC